MRSVETRPQLYVPVYVPNMNDDGNGLESQQKRTRKPRTRKNGEGSEFTYLDDKGRTVYKAVETWGFDGQGRQIQVSGKSRTSMAEARTNLFRNKVKRQVAAGQLPIDALPTQTAERYPTLGLWFEQWLPRQNIGESTRLQYESRIRIYLNPKFGSMPLRLITGSQVVNYFQVELPNLKKADGTRRLGSTAIRSVYFILYAALEDARKQGKIAINPCDAMKPPSRAQKTKEQRDTISRAKNWVPQHLLRHLDGHPDEARWLVALFALRQSEALGLTDEAVKWGKRKSESRLEIYQQLARRHKQHGCADYNPATRKWACGKQANQCPHALGESGFYLKQSLKGVGSERTLSLVEPLYGAIKRQQKAQEALRETPDFAPIEGMESLLFTNRFGRPRSQQDDRRQWRKLLDDNGVPEALRLHDARALSVSMLVQIGVEPLQIMKITGWTEGTLFAMLKTYNNQGDDHIRKPLEELGKKLTERRR